MNEEESSDDSIIQYDGSACVPSRPSFMDTGDPPRAASNIVVPFRHSLIRRLTLSQFEIEEEEEEAPEVGVPLDNIEEEIEEEPEVPPVVVINHETDKIKTYLRIRPLTLPLLSSSTSAHLKSTQQVQGNLNNNGAFVIENDQTLLVRHPPKKNSICGTGEESRFTFSRVFGSDSTQSFIFEQCVQNLLTGLFSGESGLIFSYGASNSGKTYTMQGYGKDFGIVPRTLEHLFNNLEDCLYKKGDIKPHLFDNFIRLDQSSKKQISDTKDRVLKEAKIAGKEYDSFVHNMSISRSILAGHSEIFPGIQSGPNESMTSNSTIPNVSTLYSIWVSFAEIYNEKVYDLLEPIQKGKVRKDLRLYQDKLGRTYIKDLIECSVNTAEEAYQFFLAGKGNLQFGATLMNANSSRSHSFFNIRMVAIGKSGDNLFPKEVHRFSFCDLAGLERVAQTGNIGHRLKESGNINQSLLVLLRCIRALRQQQQNKSKLAPNLKIPFRDSKLTRLFQSYLTSSSRVSMIINVNPEPEMLETSIQVIQNAAIASSIRVFRKIEPQFESTLNMRFVRKVRDSIGLKNNIKLSNKSHKRKAESDDEESGSDDESTAKTIKKKPFVIPSLFEQNKNLKEENSKLAKKCEKIEDKIREELRVQNEKIIRDLEEHYTNMLVSQKRILEHERKNKLSFAVKYGLITINHDRINGASDEDIDNRIFNQVNLPSSMLSPPAAGAVVDEEASDVENTPKSSLVLKTPNDSYLQETDLNERLMEANYELRKVKSNEEDLLGTISALQDIIDTKNALISGLKEEKNELVHKIMSLEAQIIEHISEAKKYVEMPRLIENLTEAKKEIEKLKENIVDLEFNILAKNEDIEKLEVSNKKLKKDKKELQDQVNSGLAMIVDYDSKIQDANSRNKDLTEQVNQRYNNEVTLKDEIDFFGSTVDELKKRVAKLEEELRVKSELLESFQSEHKNAGNNPHLHSNVKNVKTDELGRNSSNLGKILEFSSPIPTRNKSQPQTLHKNFKPNNSEASTPMTRRSAKKQKTLEAIKRTESKEGNSFNISSSDDESETVFKRPSRSVSAKSKKISKTAASQSESAKKSSTPAPKKKNKSSSSTSSSNDNESATKLSNSTETQGVTPIESAKK